MFCRRYFDYIKRLYFIRNYNFSIYFCSVGQTGGFILYFLFFEIFLEFSRYTTSLTGRKLCKSNQSVLKTRSLTTFQTSSQNDQYYVCYTSTEVYMDYRYMLFNKIKWFHSHLINILTKDYGLVFRVLQKNPILPVVFKLLLKKYNNIVTVIVKTKTCIHKYKT